MYVMSKEWARDFYNSDAWKKTRNAYAASVGGLCEKCDGITPGEIVHHVTWLTPDNIHDPSITLGWDNLMLVCRECHAQIHGKRETRWKVDELGRVTPHSR